MASQLSSPAIRNERASRLTPYPVELVAYGVSMGLASVSGRSQIICTGRVSWRSQAPWRFLDQLVSLCSIRSPVALGTLGPAAHHMLSTGPPDVPTPLAVRVLSRRSAGSQLAGDVGLVVAQARCSLGGGAALLHLLLNALPFSGRRRAETVATSSPRRTAAE